MEYIELVFEGRVIIIFIIIKKKKVYRIEINRECKC